MKIYRIGFMVAICLPLVGRAQSADSLAKVLEGLSSEQRVDRLLEWSWESRDSKPYLTVEWAAQAEILAREARQTSKMNQAISYQGVGQRNMGNYKAALETYSRARKSCLETHDSTNLGYTLINFGNLFMLQDLWPQSVEYLQQALPIAKGLSDTAMLGYCHVNLARSYIGLGELDSAMRELVFATEVRRNNPRGLTSVIRELGDLHFKLENWDEAERYYLESSAISRSINDIDGLAENYNLMSHLYLRRMLPDSAMAWSDRSMALAHQVSSSVRIIEAYHTRAMAQASLGLFEEAYATQKVHLLMADSLNKANSMRQVELLQAVMEVERGQAQIAIMQREAQIDRLVKIALAAFLLLVFFFAIYLFRSMKQKQLVNAILLEQNEKIRKQRDEIEEKSHRLEEANQEVLAQNEVVQQQKNAIEKKNENIQSSINYASSIQRAMLPSSETIAKGLPQHFLLYLPRETVSGDFYWYAENNGKIFFTAADCTGHGVPGAFMSMIGNELLFKIVIENAVQSPEEILRQLHLGVNSALQQEVTGNQDGMDIALCVYDPATKILEFSGAKNSMVITRSGKTEVIKGGKMGIGGKQAGKHRGHERDYPKHTLQLEGRTCIYLFSDGYQDQFGWEDGRKFMSRNLHNLMAELSPLPIEQQRERLERHFLDWKGELDQIDDVVVFGAIIEA